MAIDARTNFAYGTVLTAPSPATSGTTMTLSSGAGALMPAVPFNLTIWPTGANPLASTAEIVRVTAITGDGITAMTRAQEGTSARTIIVGDQVAQTITKKIIDDIETDIAAKVPTNGALGTPTSGTLTNATGLPIASGVSGLGTGIATALAVNVGSAGAPVLLNGALGTPTSGTLTSATGLPISTGVSGLGSNVATFLGTPSSANLAAALTDETGTGLAVFGTAPTLASTVTIGTPAGTTGAALFRGTTSGTVTLSVANAAGTWTMKLPTAAGTSGHFLQTDGSGNTTWAAAAGGGITIGSSTITSGTNTRILYNNAGVVGEYTVTGSGTQAVLATAPTLTGPVTLTGAVGSSALTITGETQTASFPALDLSQTWNNAGVTFTGLKFNITNTASNAASLIFDWQLGGTSVLYQKRTGALKASSWGHEIHGDTSVTSFLQLSTSRNCFSVRNFSNASVNSEMAFGWSSTVQSDGTLDVQLYRDAAGVLAQRNSTNAQTFRLYGTYTDASNYERLGLTWATNVIRIGAANAGTGTARVMTLDYGGTTTAAISVPITSGAVSFGGGTIANSGTAIPAGGTAGAGVMVSSTANFGTFFGSGAPTLSAAKGSLYLRSDGSATNNRAYINTDGGTTWTALTTAA